MLNLYMLTSFIVSVVQLTIRIFDRGYLHSVIVLRIIYVPVTTLSRGIERKK